MQALIAVFVLFYSMAIIFPLLMVPTYEASNGDPLIFYATVASVLSGAVAGDHSSPISDTTILSALASDCQLLAHVSTQAPYAFFTIVLSILFGTIPIGRKAWPNIVGIVLGALVIGLITWLYAKPIVNSNGNYDIVTELILRFRHNEELITLKKDTADFFAGKDERLLDDDGNKNDKDPDAADELEFDVDSVKADEIYKDMDPDPTTTTKSTEKQLSSRNSDTEVDA
jgi:Na+/H+ antiporter family